MPKGAVKCNACGSYRDSRRYFVASSTILSLLVALIAVLTPAITAVSNFIDRNSHTDFELASATEDVVLLTVWNTGQKPSAILSGRLQFTGLPIDDVHLDVSEIDTKEARNIIRKEDRLPVALITVPPFQGLHNHGLTYSKEDIQKKLDRQQVTLYLNVEESNGAVARSRTFTVDRILPFIMGRIYK